MRQRLGPQVLHLLRCEGSPQYLVAVWVVTEVPYHVAGGLGLGDPELCPRLEVRRGVGRLLLFVEDHALVEGEVVFMGLERFTSQPLATVTARRRCSSVLSWATRNEARSARVILRALSPDSGV